MAKKKKKTSQQSWFSVSRKVYSRDKSTEFGADPLLREIWTTLIAWANWQNAKNPLPRQRVILTRGQLTTSATELAEYCRATRKQVRFRLNHLVLTGRIKIDSKPGVGAILTILNFDKHQPLTEVLPVDRAVQKTPFNKGQGKAKERPSQGQSHQENDNSQKSEIIEEINTEGLILACGQGQTKAKPGPSEGHNEYKDTSIQPTQSLSTVPDANGAISVRTVSEAVKTLHWQADLAKGGYRFSSSAHAAAHARKNMNPACWDLLTLHFASWDHFSKEFADQYRRGFSGPYQRRLEGILSLLLDADAVAGQNQQNSQNR